MWLRENTNTAVLKTLIVLLKLSAFPGHLEHFTRKHGATEIKKVRPPIAVAEKTGERIKQLSERKKKVEHLQIPSPFFKGFEIKRKTGFFLSKE